MLTKADIDWLKSELSPHIVHEVVKQLGGKIDKMYTKLDKFVGDIVDKRETQELHAKQHSDVDDTFNNQNKRIARIERHLKISASA